MEKDTNIQFPIVMSQLNALISFQKQSVHIAICLLLGINVSIISVGYRSNLFKVNYGEVKSVCFLYVWFKRHNYPMILRGKDMNILFPISEYPDVTS